MFLSNFITLLLFMLSTSTKTPDFSTYPVYKGKDLGLSYVGNTPQIRVYAPVAEEVQLSVYQLGTGGNKSKEIAMEKSSEGTWVSVGDENWLGKFYTVKVKIAGNWNDEVCDIYAKMVGINGQRAFIGKLNSTDPLGWEKDRSPALNNINESIIYEMNVRDFSISKNSGMKNKGKFLAFTENETKNSKSENTGVAHLNEIGVTHIHLLPFFDFRSIDERNSANAYNWGYDPLNYNVPEGSFSTDANNPESRIKELKQLVQNLHKNKLRVVMDVVYNHTGLTEKSNFNQLVPGYYYRQWEDGKFSDAAACGNETASEQPMMQKFMIESLVFWLKEYHLDGFRFDLMAIHDIKTMNKISDTLHKLKPDILLYGEGWTAKDSPLAANKRALKANTSQLKNIAVFSDEFRDGIKGKWNKHEEKGFVSGNYAAAESVKFGIVGGVNHSQIDYSNVNYSKDAWANSPSQFIGYVSCHDDLTLFDKINLANVGVSEFDRLKMNRLANTIVLTSQGIPFLHGGVEFLTTKNGNSNSYNAGDNVNQFDWERKTQNADEVNYYKNLIKLRKNHPALRMTTREMIESNLQFIPDVDSGLIAYKIINNANKDVFNEILVCFNGSATQKTIKSENKIYTQILNEKEINEKGIKKVKGNSILIPAFSAAIFYRE